MTRRDFEAIAKVLATTSDREAIGRSLADYFETANPRFDRAQFLEAARVQDTGLWRAVRDGVY